MAESAFARCRSAALFGLLLQLLAFGVTLGLAVVANASALAGLAWYILGGVPIWFAALLVFRQHELAELEKMDLDALRREKEAAGAGEGMFAQDAAGGLGYMLAANRLTWMRRWLLPTFSLVTAAYLATMAWLYWRGLPGRLDSDSWPVLNNVSLAMIGCAALLIVLFLFSRYASGLARVPAWQLLRACGAYMLGNTVAILTLIICFGVQLYAGAEAWHRALAYAIPIVMVMLAVEILLNFILDIYRPRVPGTEPRAAFDSRILGLLSEPGGLAHSIAEAINYQFGFQVSQTWFYQLLQRAFVPLVALGLLSLWLLTCLVLVQPNERAIVERFGRQMNADDPWQPGLHFKLPWPFERVSRFNTGELHQLTIGYADDAEPAETEKPVVVSLWTDERHYGRTHYNFLVAPPTGLPTPSTTSAPVGLAFGPSEARVGEAAPVHVIRMNVAVQYRIRDEALATFSQRTGNPHELLRDLAWEEVLRYSASSDVDALLGEKRTVAGRELRDGLARRVDELGLGLEIIYVGLQEVHPEKTVAEAFRNVVGADQKRITEIRQARVTENQTLSRVAGDVGKAVRIFRASDRQSHYERVFNQTEADLGPVLPQVPPPLLQQLEALEPLFTAAAAAEGLLAETRTELEQVQEDVDLGLGRSLRDRQQAEAAERSAAADVQAADEARQRELAALRGELAAAIGAAPADTFIEHVSARYALAYWSARLEEEFLGDESRRIKPVDGEAAARLAAANAARWSHEQRAVAETASLMSEYVAYAAAPEIYQVRRYLDVLVQGLLTARKFVVAFDPGDRKVLLRIDAQDTGDATPMDMPVRASPTP